MALMERIDLQVGDRVLLAMPFSEAMMHLRLAGEVVEVEVLGRWVAQIWRNGERFSFPVTWGEAGIYDDSESAPYAYDGELVGGPRVGAAYAAQGVVL